MEHLTGNIGTLCLNNWGGLVIKINDCGDGLQYQYQFGTDISEIKEAEIEYFEDTDDRTGYAEDELLQAGFKTDKGEIYFLGEFMRAGV